MIAHIRSMPIASGIGVLLGVIMTLLMPQLTGVTYAFYDKLFPVLEMAGQLEGMDNESVLIHISGKKLRGEECRLKSVFGYTIRADKKKQDAIAIRVDKEQEDRLREAGDYDIGLWRIYPVFADAMSVEVWTHHECVGRPILTMIADIKLKGSR